MGAIVATIVLLLIFLTDPEKPKYVYTKPLQFDQSLQNILNSLDANVTKQDSSSSTTTTTTSPTVTVSTNPTTIQSSTDVSSKLGLPQLISDTEHYLLGRLLAIHEAGYMAASFDPSIDMTNDTSKLKPGGILFSTWDKPTQKWIKDIEIVFPDTNLRVHELNFAPTFGKSNEVFYLFATLSNQSIGLYETGRLTIPNQIRLYTKTKQNSQSWAVSPSWLLKHPFQSTNNVPFGWHTVVRIDQSFTYPTHAVYVSASQYDPFQPGGSVFFFILQDNSNDPAVRIQYQFKDVKLARMVSFTPTKQIHNSYGCNFDVNDNWLAIGNASDEDSEILQRASAVGQTPVEQPAAPYGYVQVLKRKANSDLDPSFWQQIELTSRSNVFAYRYMGNSEFSGFGQWVKLIQDDILCVGSGFSAQIVLYQLASQLEQSMVSTSVQPLTTITMPGVRFMSSFYPDALIGFLVDGLTQDPTSSSSGTATGSGTSIIPPETIGSGSGSGSGLTLSEPPSTGTLLPGGGTIVLFRSDPSVQPPPENKTTALYLPPLSFTAPYQVVELDQNRFLFSIPTYYMGSNYIQTTNISPFIEVNVNDVNPVISSYGRALISNPNDNPLLPIWTHTGLASQMHFFNKTYLIMNDCISNRILTHTL